MKNIAYILFSILLISSNAFAAKVPYFATLKRSAVEANVRTGPGTNYPVTWVYQKPGWPVEVVATFEMWRKISDVNGEVGWVHESLLSPRRNIVVKTSGYEQVYSSDDNDKEPIFIVENGVVASLKECKNELCYIEVNDGLRGWIASSALWGV